MKEALPALLARAQARRDEGAWDEAIRLFGQAAQAAPASAAIRHNLALCHFARGDTGLAGTHAAEAVRRDPALWQSQALIARIARSENKPAVAAAAWEGVLAEQPGNGAALLGLADLDLNEYGDVQAASERVAPLSGSVSHGADAELTQLMAALYTGAQTAEMLSRALMRFSQTHLRLPPLAPRAIRTGRRRIGLISPLLSASPVYYLTFSTFYALAGAHDLVIFNRGGKSDAATDRFREIAAEWVDVQSLDAAPLAQRLASAELDIIFDLGGWSDAVGLKALSAKPAARMYSWVGGQSATTGVSAFDGWIGDAWQSPAELAPLYAEPLVNMAGGYVDYTPPAALAALADLPKSGVALVGNPAKIVPATLAAWPDGVGKVSLIDRRYVHARTLDRVTALLEGAGIRIERVIVSQGHADYLRALAGNEAIVNTQPYAAGLTAVEAHHLGVRLLSAGSAGALFCSRHHLSHLKTGGRNPGLAAAMLALVSL